jgi:hypothetical protein
VRADANLEYTVAELVDGTSTNLPGFEPTQVLPPGAFFNSGQSCCAIEVLHIYLPIHTHYLLGFLAHLRPRVTVRQIRGEIHRYR